MKTFDPQIVVDGILKPAEGGKSEIIVFTVNLALFELVCIVNIPPEGETKAPTYVKFKIRKERRPHDGMVRPNGNGQDHEFTE